MSRQKVWFVYAGCDVSYIPCGGYIIPVEWLDREENKLVKRALSRKKNRQESDFIDYLTKEEYFGSGVSDSELHRKIEQLFKQFRVKGEGLMRFDSEDSDVEKIICYSY